MISRPRPTAPSIFASGKACRENCHRAPDSVLFDSTMERHYHFIDEAGRRIYGVLLGHFEAGNAQPGAGFGMLFGCDERPAPAGPALNSSVAEHRCHPSSRESADRGTYPEETIRHAR